MGIDVLEHSKDRRAGMTVKTIILGGAKVIE
jgi:hypothetical protein